MASRSKLDTNGADDVDFDFFDTPRPETESEVGEANKTDSDGDAVTVNVTDTDTASAANNSRVGEINKPDDSTIVSFVGSQKDNANCTKSSAFGSNNLDLSPSDSDTADRPIPRPRPRPRSHHVNDDVKRQSLALHLPSPEDKKKADYSLSSTDTESDSCSMSASETDDDSQYIPQKPPSRDAKQKPHNCRKSSSEPNCNESRLKSRSKNAWVEATTTTSMSQKPPAPKSSVTYHQQSKYNRISSKANTEQFSGSSTSDDSYTSNSDESDVTDVSPLASPHEYSRTLTGKPPKSPSTSKNAASGKLHLPNASRDAIDLKLLMQAVLELEHDAPPSSIRSGAHSQSSTVLFAPRPTSGCRKNFSFSDDQVRTIDLENHRLMRQIGRSGERPTAAAAAVRLNVSRRAQTTQRLTPSAVNRLREQERVAAENQVRFCVAHADWSHYALASGLCR